MKCACGRTRRLGTYTQHVIFRGKSKQAHDAAIEFFNRHGRINGGQSAVFTTTAHNEYNGRHDLERRLSEFLQRRQIDPQRIDLFYPSDGFWRPEVCEG